MMNAQSRDFLFKNQLKITLRCSVLQRKIQCAEAKYGSVVLGVLRPL